MKILVIMLMILYLYALSYGIFLTEIFRIPAPIIFGIPLIVVFSQKNIKFLYTKEVIALGLAVFCYYAIGISDVKTFAAYFISIIICVLYFNYFIGTNHIRFNISVIIFYSLLFLSAVVMVLNHYYPAIDGIRGMIMNEMVQQSPSGIAVFQFTFGYQLAALTPFLFIYPWTFNKSLIIKIAFLLLSLVFIYLGMQRSVFVGFICAVVLFSLVYYRFKAVLIIAFSVIIAGLLYVFVLKNNLDSTSNILTKNEHNQEEFNRTTLMSENLNIYADHPYGLIFYGKNWGNVIYRNQVFSTGITSHNAYLMFFTYLGPFLGLGLLIAIYSKVFQIAYHVLKKINNPNNALLICLCFSFLAVSINALSHNASLLSADGPTLFLYMSIIHYHKIIS